MKINPLLIAFSLMILLVGTLPSISAVKQIREVNDFGLVEMEVNERGRWNFFDNLRNFFAIIGPNEAVAGEEVRFNIVLCPGRYLENSRLVREDSSQFGWTGDFMKLVFFKNGARKQEIVITNIEESRANQGFCYRGSITFFAPTETGDYDLRGELWCTEGTQARCAEDTDSLRVTGESRCPDDSERFFTQITGGTVVREERYVGQSCQLRIYMRTQCDSAYHLEGFDDGTQIGRRWVNGNENDFWICLLDTGTGGNGNGNGNGGAGGNGAGNGNGADICDPNAVCEKSGFGGSSLDIQILDVTSPSVGAPGQRVSVKVTFGNKNIGAFRSDVNAEVGIYSIDAAESIGLVTSGLQSIFVTSKDVTSCGGSGEEFVHSKEIKFLDGLLHNEEEIVFEPVFPTSTSRLADGTSNFDENGNYVLAVGIYQACAAETGLCGYWNDACVNTKGKTYILKSITASDSAGIGGEGAGGLQKTETIDELRTLPSSDLKDSICGRTSDCERIEGKTVRCLVNDETRAIIDSQGGKESLVQFLGGALKNVFEEEESIGLCALTEEFNFIQWVKDITGIEDDTTALIVGIGVPAIFLFILSRTLGVYSVRKIRVVFV